MQLAAGKEVFVLPHTQGKDGYLIFAPLAGRVVHANADCVAQLRTYILTGDTAKVEARVIDQLGGLDWLDSAEVPQAPPAGRPFHPTRTTLFLTNRCNLRCRYCYASAGEATGHDMPPEYYRAAIDDVAANIETSREPLRVGFHGGGEPTVAWNTLAGAVEYAKQTAERMARPVQLSLATNGVMNEERRAYVGETFASITLSFDGPKDVQNAQRPMASGKGSFDRVMAFVESLRGKPAYLAIRATITSGNVRRMPEMAEFFARHVCAKTHGGRLQFEPLYARGRARDRDEDFPDPEAFVENFLSAKQIANGMGVRLEYSAARIVDARLSFCGCADSPFNITHDGGVTACFEVCSRDNPLAGDFYFGSYEPQSKTFAIDADRLARLRAMNVLNKPQCQRCFAKWTFAGDCAVKGSGFGNGSGDGRPRCAITQAITRDMLQRAIDGTVPSKV